MLKSDAAAFLAGVKQVEGAAASAPTNLHVITGEVGTTSEDGKTTVSIDGLVFSEEDSQEIQIDTLGGLEEGDIATIILTGESGHGMTPLAIGGVGSVDRLKARVVDTELLLADKADIDDLEAATARIGDLEADHVSVDTLEAATARIQNLEVDHVSVSDFEVEQANIDSLQAATADIDTIRANSAKVQNLTASQLEADHATIGTLDTTYMHANMSNADVAWIQNGTIKNGAIVSAMINDVSANKLTAGTINGSVINVTNLNADNITTGTINGQRIGEGSLSLDKLSEDVYTEADVNAIVDGLNDRIDGAIETFTGTAVPTLNNSPASSWNTTKLRDEHVGDVYYVVNSQSQQNGYCYRFTKSGSTYSWQLIKDNDVTAALSRLTTAEGKITTFDSDISQLKTDTGTLTTKTESLETRMSDAESDILDKVDTTTFNSLEDTVDGHTQTLSQHTTAISNKADGSTVTAVTNRVSKNEQDISGINTTIGELQETVESKADGSTVSSISSKLNTVSDTVDGHTSQLSSITTTQTTMQTTLDKTVKSSIQLWYSKANTTAPSKPTSQVTSTSTNGNAWRIVVPAYNASYPHYYYCWQYEYVDGTYGWSAVVRDIAMGESQATARTADSNASAAVTTANTANTNASTALTTANTANTNASDAKTAATTANTNASEAKTTAETAASDASTAKTNAASAVTTANSASTKANANIKSSVQLWFTKANSTAPNKPTSVVSTSNANTANAWNLVVPVWNSSYPHYFYCYQQQKGDGNYQWTDVVYDRATSEAQQLANTTSTSLTTLQEDYATYKQTTTENVSSIGTRLTTAEGKISTAETNITQNANNIALKVSKDGVISSINQSAETVKIQASKVEIDGTAVFNAAKSKLDAAYDAKGAAATVQTNLDNMGSDNKIVNGAFVRDVDNWAAWGSPTTRNRVQVNGKWWMHCVTTATAYQGYSQNHYTSLGVTVEPSTKYTVGITARGGAAGTKVCVGFHWFAPSGTSIVSQSWLSFTVGTTATRQYQTVTVPSGIDHFNVMVGQNVATAQEFWITDITLVKGAVNQEWSESSALATYANSTANAAAPKANAVKRTQRIWYRKSAAGAPSTPGTASSNWVTKSDDGDNAWTKMHVAISSSAKYIYTCEQYEMANGTVGYTSVLLDNTITVIDGGNIITGSVTANKLNASDINASKSLTVGAMTDAAAATILNSNISVGGRNLLKSSDAFHTPTSYNAYDLYLSEPIEDGVPYILQLWDVDVSHTGKTAATLGVDVYYCGSSVSFGGWRGTSYFTNGHADHLELRFTAYTSGATVSSGGSVNPSPTNALAHTTVVNTTKKYIRLYNSVPNATGTMNLTVGKWKLEKGNTATDWTPAPEDMAVGGRNLLAKTKELTSGVWVYDGATRGDNVALIATSNKRIYQLPSVGYWTWTTGTSYAVSVDARADASTVLEIDAYGASSNGMKKQFTVGTSWDRYAFVFTATNVNTGSLSFYRIGSASTTLYLRRPKLEVGSIATDWSPAPEDVDGAISDAAKTATSYVTDITGGGIMVHPSGNQNTGVRVTSDVDILRSGTSVANYGSTARIGTLAGKHVTIDSDSVDLMDGNASLATFGANDTHIGMSGTGNVYMANDKFLLSATTTEGTWDSTEGSVTTSVPYTEVKSGFKAQNIGTNYRVYSGLNSTLGYNDDGRYTASDTYIDAWVEDSSGHELHRAYVELWADPLYNTAIRLSGDSVELLGDDVTYVSPYNQLPLQLGKPVVRSASKSMTITSTNTWVDGPSVFLDQGQWLVVGVACFNSGSSSGNRKLRAQLRLDTSVYVEGTEVRVATNEYGRIQATAIMTVNSAEGLDATLVLSSSMNFTSATTSYVTAVQLA